MPRFFIDPSAVYMEDGVQYIQIHEDDAHHISHVLRMREGETITVCDTQGMVYEARLLKFGNVVTAQVVAQKNSDTEPPYRAVVYQALVKGDKMDTVIQKAVETGAAEIVPMITSRCMVKIDPKDRLRKTERWQKIALEAAKQCGRGIIPQVRVPVGYEEALQLASHADLALFCYEGKGTSQLPSLMQKVERPKTVSICIGPEGGFSPEEAAQAAVNMDMCGLGPRILRTETAAIFVLACLSAAYEL